MYCSASATDWIRSSCLMVVMGGYRLRTRRLARRTSSLLCRSRPGRTKRRPCEAAVACIGRSASVAVFGRDHPGVDIGVGGYAIGLRLDTVTVVVQAQTEGRRDVVTQAHAAVPAVAIGIAAAGGGADRGTDAVIDVAGAAQPTTARRHEPRVGEVVPARRAEHPALGADPGLLEDRTADERGLELAQVDVAGLDAEIHRAMPQVAQAQRRRRVGIVLGVVAAGGLVDVVLGLADACIDEERAAVLRDNQAACAGERQGGKGNQVLVHRFVLEG